MAVLPMNGILGDAREEDHYGPSEALLERRSDFPCRIHSMMAEASRCRSWTAGEMRIFAQEVGGVVRARTVRIRRWEQRLVSSGVLGVKALEAGVVG